MTSSNGKTRGAWAIHAGVLQQKYAEALQKDDWPTLIECSGSLSIAYAALGCNTLADRWMDEYINQLERIDPDIRKRMQSIRSLLPDVARGTDDARDDSL